MLHPSTFSSTTLRTFVTPLQCLEGGCYLPPHFHQPHSKCLSHPSNVWRVVVAPLNTFIDHPPNVRRPFLNVRCPPSTRLLTTLQTFAAPSPIVPPPPNVHCSKLSQYSNFFRAKGGPRSFAANQASRGKDLVGKLHWPQNGQKLGLQMVNKN